MKKLYKYISFIFILCIGVYYTVINLGYFFDISKKEINADLLLCLGGGKGERITKTIQVYKKYNLFNPKILLTDSNDHSLKKKLNLLLEANVPRENITIVNSVNNTYSELKVAHKIMIDKNYKSINIISDEPHSRRINILINQFFYNKKDNIIYNIIGSDVKWWNKKYYYKEKRRSIYFVVHESLKIVHNLIYYHYINIFDNDAERKDKNDERKEKEFITKINHFITYILTF